MVKALIISNFKNISQVFKVMLITELLNQYRDLVTYVMKLSGCANINKSIRNNIIEIIFLFMVIPGRINFLQLGRFGRKSEQCYRQTFERDLDWMEFNLHISAHTFVKAKGGNRVGIAIDPSYISKAGKKTPHIGRFWSGCAGAVKHGLEVLGIGVVDADLHDCMMLRAVQTANEKGGDNDMTFFDWYAKVLTDYKTQLQRVTRNLVADSAFSKTTFVEKILAEGYQLISRLRNDAVLHYEWKGERTGKRGRPRTSGDRIDYDDLDKSKMERIDIDSVDEEAYTLIAYCKSLKRKIRLVIHILADGGHRLYFSTDTSMPGKDVIDLYRTRFQIEFNYRDAKQFTGLTHCQARDSRKLDFAYNASFAAVNVAKALRRDLDTSLSIGRLKSMMVNAYYLERILSRFGNSPNMTLNDKLVKELFGIAAEVA